MFDPPPDLASDLEWMLQSGQVSREILAEALVQEHYAPVYRLALALLDDQSAARSAARQTFANALLDIYRFRSDEGIPAWLYGIALETCRRALKHLNRRRAIKAAIPWLFKPTDLGESQPETELDAAAWLAIDSQPELDRLVIFMHYLLDWSDEQIGAVLKGPTSRVSEWVEVLRQVLLTTVWLPFREADPENRQSWSGRVEEFLKQTLKKRWPASEPSDNELDKVARQALGRMRLDNTQRRIKTVSKELALVGITILVILGLFFGASRLWPEPAPAPERKPVKTVIVTRLVSPTPDPTLLAEETTHPPMGDNPQAGFYTVHPGDTLPEIAALMGVSVESLRDFNRLLPGAEALPGQTLFDPARLAHIQIFAATPMPAITLPPTLEPSVSADFILKRFEVDSSRTFHSLWFDALRIDYGPLGYIGPAKVNRVQAWDSQDQTLVLYGSQAQVEEAWLNSAGISFIASPGERQPQFLPVQNIPDTDIVDFPKLWASGSLSISSLFNIPARSLQVAAREEYAGRPAIVLIQLAENQQDVILRLWVDASTGFILRRQSFTPDGQTILKEIAIQQIAYNIDLPQELFTPSLPWRGGYATGYRGEPAFPDLSSTPPSRETLAFKSPPVDLDISRSRLTFQFTRPLTLMDRTIPIDLFADGYYLGNHYFSDPWNTICDRSPDGLTLAFTSPMSPPEKNYLHWFKMSRRPGQLRTYNDDPAVRQFAFSPDSAQLAIFGRHDEIMQRGFLYLLNLENLEITFLSPYADIKSLVWSPDGRYVAFIARYSASDYEDFVVAIDVNTTSMYYFASVDYESNAAADWPTIEWGVEFPVEMDTLEQCALPDSP